MLWFVFFPLLWMRLLQTSVLRGVIWDGVWGGGMVDARLRGLQIPSSWNTKNSPGQFLHQKWKPCSERWRAVWEGWVVLQGRLRRRKTWGLGGPRLTALLWPQLLLGLLQPCRPNSTSSQSPFCPFSDHSHLVWPWLFLHKHEIPGTGRLSEAAGSQLWVWYLKTTRKSFWVMTS